MLIVHLMQLMLVLFGLVLVVEMIGGIVIVIRKPPSSEDLENHETSFYE